MKMTRVSGESRRRQACGRTIWIVDAHRDNEMRFVVHADEKLIAFLELESGDSRGSSGDSDSTKDVIERPLVTLFCGKRRSEVPKKRTAAHRKSD